MDIKELTLEELEKQYYKDRHRFTETEQNAITKKFDLVKTEYHYTQQLINNIEVWEDDAGVSFN